MYMMQSDNPDEFIVSNGVWRVKSWIFNPKYGYYHNAYLLSERDYLKIYSKACNYSLVEPKTKRYDTNRHTL